MAKTIIFLDILFIIVGGVFSVAMADPKQCTPANSYLQNELKLINPDLNRPSKLAHPGQQQSTIKKGVALIEQSKLRNNREPAVANKPVALQAHKSPWPTTEYIPISCIEAAMIDRPSNAEYLSCGRSNNPTIDQVLRNSDESLNISRPAPCISSELVAYVHNEVNRVMDCINSDDDNISAKEIFGLLKNESNFIPNVRGFHYSSPKGSRASMKSYNGTGIGELTKSIRGFPVINNESLGLIWDNLKDKDACKEFAEGQRDLFSLKYMTQDKPNKVLLSHRADAQCRVTNIEDNPARNALIGLLFYKYHRNKILDMFPKKDRKNLSQDGGAGQTLSQVSYQNPSIARRLLTGLSQKYANNLMGHQTQTVTYIENSVALHQIETQMRKQLAQKLSKNPTQDELAAYDAHLGVLEFALKDALDASVFKKKSAKISSSDLNSILESISHTDLKLTDSKHDTKSKMRGSIKSQKQGVLATAANSLTALLKNPIFDSYLKYPNAVTRALTQSRRDTRCSLFSSE